MLIPSWRDPNRKRICTLSYTDKEFEPYYDLDKSDFKTLVLKLKSGQRLTPAENDRYGMHILTICVIVQENARFKLKPRSEKEELLEQQYFELLQGITGFNPDKGDIYSYAYRIAYTAAVHYYEHLVRDKERKKTIEDHVWTEYNEYLDEFSDHKTRTQYDG